MKIRFYGIDTPEMKGKDVSSEEKEAATMARDYLSDLILHKYVRLENVQNEKYGRILADVHLGNYCLNEIMVKERYAVKYDGKTKQKPSSWLNYKIMGEM